MAEDDDENFFDDFDCLFKLVALVLVNQRPKMSWSEIVKWFETDM